ncbi:MAG TPA: hypothetical protein DCE41_23660 [Cytophagales bacterium]|nr:hypothetical protein [Cytophagales bacterium]
MNPNHPMFSNHKRILPLLALVFAAFPVLGQGPLSSMNLAYQYEPNHEVKLNWQYASHPTEGEGTFYLEWRVANGEYQKYAFAYQWVEGYESPLRGDFLPAEKDSLTLHKDREHWIWRWENTIEESTPLLVIRVTNEISGNVYYFDYHIKHELDFPASDLILWSLDKNVPCFQNFVSGEESLTVKSEYGADSTLGFLYAYETDFEAALPPMATRSSRPNQSMKIAWSKPVVFGEPLDLSEERLYLLQKDTTTLEGISFQFISHAFPKYDRATLLLEPTLYLSSRREQAAMLEAPDPKTALDQFWLGAALQSPQKARTAIRYYYRAVAKVNSQFTSYKEGWKTDMGMIMTVFGPPAEVYRENEQERWVFRIPPNQQEVVFVFDKIKNIFTRQYYALQRQPQYSEIWQDQVDLWRRGLKEW